LIEPSERLAVSLESLLAGGDGLASALGWQALAAHLDAPVRLTEPELELLGAVSRSRWSEVAAVEARFGRATVRRLLDAGLLIAERGGNAAARACDQRVRDGHWATPAAVLHRHTRWRGVDSGRRSKQAGLGTTDELAAAYGKPPGEVHARGPKARRVALPRPDSSACESLLRRRVTCRNFDTRRTLGIEDLAAVLYRAFGAFGIGRFGPGFRALKKGSPSGGGMHPVEAYVLARRVEGLAPGCYHYHPLAHALEPLDLPVRAGQLPALSRKLVAGQRYLAAAQVLVVLAARFVRNQWKYRQHAKAYRVVVLDAGHLSQTFQLAATELGLGSFITAAINEVDCERAFGLDPMQEGVLAVLGVGHRALMRRTLEFDAGAGLAEARPAPAKSRSGAEPVRTGARAPARVLPAPGPASRRRGSRPRPGARARPRPRRP
jgi:putative peptide maturation dehydrogenase